ncbi:MAG: hypothetical protein ACXVAX_10785, partial [Pseudobdellovibrio sp.]
PPAPPPSYPPSYPPPPSNPGYGSDTKTIYVSRNVMNESIDLRAYGGVDYNYQGWEIVAVRANTRPNSPTQTVAQIVVDGRVFATQINPGYQINLIPQQTLIVGENANDIRLSVVGGTYIDSNQVELRQSGSGYNPNPNGQNIDINVYRSVTGSDRIDLTQYFDLSRYYGLHVVQVLVTASTNYNSGYVSLIVNGLNLGQIQFNNGYSQRQAIYLSNQPMIGNGADSLVLSTAGDMTIEQVTLVVR